MSVSAVRPRGDSCFCGGAQGAPDSGPWSDTFPEGTADWFALAAPPGRRRELVGNGGLSLPESGYTCVPVRVDSSSDRDDCRDDSSEHG